MYGLVFSQHHFQVGQQKISISTRHSLLNGRLKTSDGAFSHSNNGIH